MGLSIGLAPAHVKRTDSRGGRQRGPRKNKEGKGVCRPLQARISIMADLVKVKTALISVSDKSNLLELAAALKDCGVQVQPVDARVLPAVACPPPRLRAARGQDHSLTVAVASFRVGTVHRRHCEGSS